MDTQIRLATVADSDAILEIYAPYITETAISFETEVPSGEEFRGRVAGILRAYPYLVCQEAGKLLGYAYASQHKARAAYRYCVEVSIYLRMDCRSRGIGSQLYGRLFQLLREQGFYTAYAGITLPNEKSLRLHEKFGFTVIGTHHNTGYKLGRWLDVIWLEKPLNDYAVPPGDIRPVGEIAPSL